MVMLNVSVLIFFFFVGKLFLFLFLEIREKFWKIGNKERYGEYGVCFFFGWCVGG